MKDTMEDDTQSDGTEKTKTLRVEDWERPLQSLQERIYPVGRFVKEAEVKE